MKTKFFFLIIGIIGATILIQNNVFATSITLTPNAGPLGTSVTVKGNGFTPSIINNQEHNFQAASSTGFNTDSIWLEKFTAIPGNTTTNLTILTTNNGTGNFTFTQGLNDGHSTGFTGSVYVSRFDLPSSGNITKVGIHAFTSTGHIRYKVYQDDASGGGPSTLLFESGNLLVAGNENITLASPIPVGPTKHIWVGFELDTTTPPSLKWCTTAGLCPNVKTDLVAHTYGTGPSPFGAITVTTDHPEITVNYEIKKTYFRIKAYQDNGAGGGPSTLLGQSGPQLIGGNAGFNHFGNYTISALVPVSGNIWVGFENNINLTSSVGTIEGGINWGPIIKYTNPQNSNTTSHHFGSGPNPISTHNTSDGPYMRLYFTPGIHQVNLKFDGSALGTSPSPILTNSSGGFSGVIFTNPSSVTGLHTVNASDTSFFATASFNVTSGFAYNVLQMSGYVLSNNGIFPFPQVFTTKSYNVTQLGLYDTGLLQSHTFSPPINTTAGAFTTIPWNFTDTGRSGSVTYTEIAILTNGTVIALQSNPVTLTYGTVVLGQVNVNQTNTNFVPIWFHRADSGSNTRLDVIFPNTANMTCNINYQLAQLNKTYFNIPKIVYDPTQDNSSFLFVNSTNDVIKVFCRDLKTTNTGSYLITQFNFPFIQQIKSFQAGTFGTHGQFGMLDIVSLSIIIVSMIGFNRINESVGAFFGIAIMGACWFFGIMSFPGVVFGAMTLVIGIAILSTRKTGGF